jgi:serine/threonine protein phosphatase PrpC
MIDSIVKKGAFHRSMPQDYVVAEDLGTAKQPFPFIAVADGCSAGQHSEIGAMILARAALATAKYYRDRLGLNHHNFGTLLQETMLDDVARRSRLAAEELKLELDDMIATLRIAYVYDSIIYTIETGDGYHFIVHTDGQFDMFEYDYEINAPYYLAYEMYNKVREYDGIGVNHLRERIYKPAFGEDTLIIRPSKDVLHQQFFINDVDYFGLATDGIASYMMEDGSGVAVKPEAIVSQLSQIKVPAGEFLVRRFQKMDRELESKGFKNMDDCGIAMISVFTYKATLEANK